MARLAGDGMGAGAVFGTGGGATAGALAASSAARVWFLEARSSFATSRWSGDGAIVPAGSGAAARDRVPRFRTWSTARKPAEINIVYP